MRDKILTISIAAYNSEKYIRSCLDSVLNCKKHDKLEIFVIDDGGIDKTLEIAKEYVDKHPNIIFSIHKENGGWGSTVNYSIDNATGKYIKLLDADDEFNSDKLDEYIDFLEKCNDDLIITPYIENNIINNACKNVDDKPLQMHSFTVRSEVLKKNNIKLTEKCFYTDIEYVFLALGVSKSKSNFDKHIYVYNVGYEEQSVNNKQFVKHIDEHETVCKSVLSIYGDISNKELCIDKKLVFDRLLELIYKHYSVLYMLPINNRSLQRIEEFDNYIKNNTNLYEAIRLRRVRLLRLNKYFYYPVAMFLHFRSSIFNFIKGLR